jgi:hypothetical protein
MNSLTVMITKEIGKRCSERAKLYLGIRAIWNAWTHLQTLPSNLQAESIGYWVLSVLSMFRMRMTTEKISSALGHIKVMTSAPNSQLIQQHPK